MSTELTRTPKQNKRTEELREKLSATGNLSTAEILEAANDLGLYVDIAGDMLMGLCDLNHKENQ